MSFVSLASAEVSLRGDVFAAVQGQKVKKQSSVNSNNTILEIPDQEQSLELRPDLQWSFFDGHSLTVRTRHFAQFQQIDFSGAQSFEEKTESKSDISDFYFDSSWSETLSTSVGLQNYQWGPAELFSPTNPFYHFNNNQRSFFYKEKGQALVRVNWNPKSESRPWSLVLLYQTASNNEPHWMAEKKFSPKSVLKIERQFENPSNSVAGVFGTLDDNVFFLGENLNWAPSESWSLYADVQYKMKKTNYAPQANGIGGFDMVELTQKKNKTAVFAIVGVRWEGRVDLRQEFIQNDAGYSAKKWDQALQAATTLSPLIVQNASRFSRPGLEFRTQQYSYTSIRIPDLGDAREVSVALRHLTSLTQNSSATQLNWEFNANDSTVLSAEVVLFSGARNTEFTLLSEGQAALGLKYSW